MRIGLIGTDSPKKRHGDLLTAARGRTGHDRLRFVALGMATPYYQELVAQHPDAQLTLVNSETCTLDAFLDNVDVIVSVARGEGFSRPVAAALARGVPCVLIDDPVFREFYEGCALFGADAAEVLALVEQAVANTGQQELASFPPESLTQAFATGVQRLRQLLGQQGDA